MFKCMFSRFLRDESGAVSTDFVVLSAAVIAIAIASAKYFFVDAKKVTMAVTASNGEIIDVHIVADSIPSKLLIVAQFYGVGFTKCLFGDNVEIDTTENINEGAICRYILGAQS